MKTNILYATYSPDSEAEEKASYILTEGNLANIRSLLAMEVQKRLNLSVDPNNYAAFVQAESEIKGAILAYQTLLNSHADTIQALSNPQPSSES